MFVPFRISLLGVYLNLADLESIKAVERCIFACWEGVKSSSFGGTKELAGFLELDIQHWEWKNY